MFFSSQLARFNISKTNSLYYIPQLKSNKMISTRLTIIHRNVVPRVVNAMFQQRHILSNYNRTSTMNSDVNKPSPNPTFVGIPTERYMSTLPAVDTTEIRGMVSDGKSTIHETKQKTPGHVTRTLRVLDINVVRKILEELKSVDVNADGR